MFLMLWGKQTKFPLRRGRIYWVGGRPCLIATAFTHNSKSFSFYLFFIWSFLQGLRVVFRVFPFSLFSFII